MNPTMAAPIHKPTRNLPIPVIDTHIHLWPDTALSTLNWCTPDHDLWVEHSVQKYLSAVSSISTSISDAKKEIDPYATTAFTLKGFIFVESDRKSSLDPPGDGPGEGWSYPLEEVSFVADIAAPEAEHAQFCLGMVPWAPIPSGSSAMSDYYIQVLLRTQGVGDVRGKSVIKGFRYLLQDKQPGTMLSDRFVESLKWMGHQHLSFDLGIDMRSGGPQQLNEAIEMMRRVNAGAELGTNVVVVISKQPSK
jgi:L-rhamnono-1,4-lactonase